MHGLPNLKIYNYNSFIDTNFIHNFLYKLRKIKFLYMFRASSAHLQEVSDIDLLKMSGWRSKHVEELNFM